MVLKGEGKTSHKESGGTGSMIRSPPLFCFRVKKFLCGHRTTRGLFNAICELSAGYVTRITAKIVDIALTDLDLLCEVGPRFTF